MNITLLNQTWSNKSHVMLQNVTNTLDDVESIKNSPKTSITWADEKKAMYIAEIILHCIFLAVGSSGNVLTIAVLVYKKWKNVTSRHILIALAISDSFMIITNTFNQDFLKDLLKLDARAFSDIGCKIFYIIYRTSKITSSWFVVFLCIERFVAVKFPLKVKAIITDKRTKVYILVVYLTMAGFASFLSLSTAIVNKTCKKDAVATNEKQMFRALMLTEMLLYSVVPIILMSILTPIIILQLYKRYQNKKALTNKTEKGKEREIQQLQELIRTTTVLISVVAAFIVCVTPITVFQQLKFWLPINKKEMETNYAIYMFREASQRFEQINYSINFFLYIFTSPTFRKKVLEMLHFKQNNGNMSSNDQTRQTRIAKEIANTNDITSTSGQTKYGRESVGMETICNQLVSSKTTDPPKEEGTNCTEIPDNNTPTTIKETNGEKTEQSSEPMKDHQQPNCKVTVKISNTVSNQDHSLQTYTDHLTNTNIVETETTFNNNNSELISTNDQDSNNIPVENAQESQLEQPMSTSQVYMDDSFDSVFTDEL